MPLYAYDLHIHTCLSPCGDALMTPPNIANMANIKGLDIIAITDHNSARNVRAVMSAAKGLPLKVIPGIEVTTAEEIHVVCLFPDADSAENAGGELEKHLPSVQNRPEYFGEQVVMDENEEIAGTFPLLLPNALDISIDSLPKLVGSFGGFCYPAHIDRASDSIIAVFGEVPETPKFVSLEVHDLESFFGNADNVRYKDGYIIVTSSDAHRLQDISERENFVELPELSFNCLRRALCSDTQ
ncbi:MAG: phosphoesterase [Firmicutes bacterium HGW-Firmicutes-16]|nr:MAG: phosphoesterase [Firmicutes bacterium HGW-Firmicutes-16]